MFNDPCCQPGTILLSADVCSQLSPATAPVNGRWYQWTTSSCSMATTSCFICSAVHRQSQKKNKLKGPNKRNPRHWLKCSIQNISHLENGKHEPQSSRCLLTSPIGDLQAQKNVSISYIVTRRGIPHPTNIQLYHQKPSCSNQFTPHS